MMTHPQMMNGRHDAGPPPPENDDSSQIPLSMNKHVETCLFFVCNKKGAKHFTLIGLLVYCTIKKNAISRRPQLYFSTFNKRYSNTVAV